MYPVIQQPSIPITAYTRYPNRPIRGIGFHHTAGTSLYTPATGKSAHKVIMPSGTIYQQIADQHAAHTILKTDLWRPNWMLRCPDGRVSDANYCTLNYEFVYAPQPPYNQIPTTQQYDAAQQLLQTDYAKYGVLPIIGHGQVQSDKWATEPHGFHYPNSQIGPFQAGVGRFYNPTPPPMNPIDDDTIRGYLESYGTRINPATAIMRFVYEAFRDGKPPLGNWRGPALEPGEYEARDNDGGTVIRHRFTAGIVEYNPRTGGCGWVEVVLHPEHIQP